MAWLSGYEYKKSLSTDNTLESAEVDFTLTVIIGSNCADYIDTIQENLVTCRVYWGST